MNNNNNISSSSSPQVLSLQELAAFSTLKTVYRFPHYNVPKHIVDIVGDVKVKEQFSRYRDPSFFIFHSFRTVLNQFLRYRAEMIELKRETVRYLRRGDHPPLLTIERPIFDSKGSFFYMQEYCPGGMGPILPIYPFMECIEKQVKRYADRTFVTNKLN